MEGVFRQKISSDVKDLNALNKIYDWIPNEETIRPDAEVRALKHSKMIDITENWRSYSDYILCQVFGKESLTENNKFYARDSRGISSRIVFQPNDFPYNLPKTHHYILWYGTRSKDYDDCEITRHISEKIQECTSSTNFSFAWLVVYF